MRAIHCVLFSFVCIYTAIHIHKKEPHDYLLGTLKGVFVVMSWISLIVSVILMFLGI